jgi:hypothetical protein
VIRKLVYAAVAATFLAPVPALAGQLEPHAYYGDDYDDDYAPVVRKKVIIIERPIVRKRVVVERPVIVKKRYSKRYVIEERPLRYGKRHYGKRYYDDDDDVRYGKRHYRKRYHERQFDDDEVTHY